MASACGASCLCTTLCHCNVTVPDTSLLFNHFMSQIYGRSSPPPRAPAVRPPLRAAPRPTCAPTANAAHHTPSPGRCAADGATARRATAQRATARCLHPPSARRVLHRSERHSLCVRATRQVDACTKLVPSRPARYHTIRSSIIICSRYQLYGHS